MKKLFTKPVNPLKSFRFAIMALLLGGTLAIPMLQPLTAWALSGGGTPSNPYLIESCDDIPHLSDSDQYFKLSDSLDCTSQGNDIVAWTFTGHLDGNSKTITIDLTEPGDPVNGYGLIGVMNGGTIHDLTVNGHIHITDGYSQGIGGVVGNALSGATLTNLTSNVFVEAPNVSLVGGVVGEIQGGTADGLVSTGEVDGLGSVGGLSGQSLCGSVITNSHSQSTVNGSQYVGGFTGFDGCMGPGSQFQNDYATGDVTGDQQVGGFAGLASGSTIGQVYATGDVGATGDSVGGLMGEMDGGTLDQSYYKSGSVTGDNNVGGLIGSGQDTSVLTNDYANAQLDGTQYIGGLAGTGTIDISNSYALGHILGSTGVTRGGLVGTLGDGSTVTGSFAAVSIDSTEPLTVGGLIGAIGDVNVTTSYVDKTVNSQGCETVSTPDTSPTFDCNEVSTPGYFFNNITNPPFGDGSGAVWNFDSIWSTQPSDFPCLQWENSCVSSENGPPIPDDIYDTLNSAADGSAIEIHQSGCLGAGESSTTTEPKLAVQDPAYQYPVGFAGFTFTGCNASATITAIFTGEFDPATAVIRKYDATNHSFTSLTTANSGLVLTKTTLNGKAALQAVYTVTDGGALDQDGQANGTIVDPIGVAEAVVGVPNTGFARK